MNILTPRTSMFIANNVYVNLTNRKTGLISAPIVNFFIQIILQLELEL